MICFKFIVFVWFSSRYVLCANILYIDPVPSPSHHIWNRALSFALAEKGHNVTIITHDVDKPPLPKNYTPIIFEGIYKEIGKKFNLLDLVVNNSPFDLIKMFVDWCEWTCDYDLKSEGLKQLLNYPNDFKFDLIIYETTASQCLHYLVERFNFPPTIAVTPFILPPYLAFTFGNDLYTSYVPFYGVPHTDKMSFKERFLNMIYVYYLIYVWRTTVYNSQMEMSRKRFGDNIKTIDEIDNHINLLLSNTDPILDYPQPLPPSIIPVGGLHVGPSKNLPQDLEKIANEATHGFIIFSLGTNVRSDRIGQEKLSAVLETFKKLPQTVLWKYESDDLKNIPSNVIIRNWLPINDLLGHPNIKLFITHGGALSTHEAMYHGVPIVGIPVFSDQHVNLKKIATKGLGVTVDFQKLNHRDLYSAVIEVLNNPIYNKNMKDLSKRYRDQPQTPLERAIFYIEYTIRHKDGRFPNIASRHMSFYQSNNLDIFAVLLVGVLVVIAVTCKLLKVLKNLMRIGTKNKNKLKTT